MSSSESVVASLVRHAQDFALRWEMGPLLSASDADRLLDRACDVLDDAQLSDLVVAVGFWLGEHWIHLAGGRWGGWDEPVAPRVECGGLIVSPIDAVRRRVERADSKTLDELTERLRSSLSQGTSEPHSAVDLNAQAWDQLADDSHFVAAESIVQGAQVSASQLDSWLVDSDVNGCRVLLLGAGGGTHAPLFAAAGAQVTVVDTSPRMLARDQMLATRLGHSINMVRASADALPKLDDEPFDTVIQPVVSCYLPDVRALYREVHRVLRPGGLYLSQHKQPAAMRTRWNTIHREFELTTGVADESPLHESGTREFAHGLEALLGGLCRAGFVIEDVHEPLRADAWSDAGSLEHLASHTQPYLKIKARRLA